EPGLTWPRSSAPPARRRRPRRRRRRLRSTSGKAISSAQAGRLRYSTPRPSVLACKPSRSSRAELLRLAPVVLELRAPRVPDAAARRRRRLQAGVRRDSRWRACFLLSGWWGLVQGVAATARPLRPVSAATMTIAVADEVASAPTPAISAPTTKPKSRQKRQTPTARAHSQGPTPQDTPAST